MWAQVSYPTDLGPSPQSQGHCCWPVMGPTCGLSGDEVRVPPSRLPVRAHTGTLQGLPGRLPQQPRGGRARVPASAGRRWKARRPGRSAPSSRRSPRRAVSLAVHFRYVVFHPFLDEILIGKIKGCSPEGVHGNGP